MRAFSLAAFVAAVLAVPVVATAQTASPTGSPSYLVSGMAQGQSGSHSQGVGIGVKGGFLFSTFRDAKSGVTQSFDNNNGWEAGIFFGGNRPGVLGVMGEVLYAKKGAKSGGVAADNYYLEIPILARVNIGSANKNTGAIVYAIGGPAFDVLLKARQKDLDVKNNYESLDIGIIAGAGVEISRFLVEGRMNWGLRNVLKASGGLTNDIKTRSFALLAGVRFN